MECGEVCVTVGEGVCHHVEVPGVVLQPKLESKKLVDPLVLWNRLEMLVLHELEAEVVMHMRMLRPHGYGSKCWMACTNLISSTD